jgi:hypothetical protein
MVLVTPSAWAVERFEHAAGQLQEAVVAAIVEAHQDAVAAQAASGTPRRDPYGHTMKNRQHECLVARIRDGDVPGAEVFHPRGAAFDLVRIPATNTVLFPWRYATDGQQAREDVRMRTSGFRRDLLAAVGDGRGQLRLEHADVQDEELEARLAEEEQLATELRRYARVVTVGYASSPAGILDLGWGDAELVGEDGTVDWRHWEPLTTRLNVAPAGDHPQSATPLGLRPLTAPERVRLRTPRFDDAPLIDDFDLQVRGPLDGEPTADGHPKMEDTGTGDERP